MNITWKLQIRRKTTTRE